MNGKDGLAKGDDDFEYNFEDIEVVELHSPDSLPPDDELQPTRPALATKAMEDSKQETDAKPAAQECALSGEDTDPEAQQQEGTHTKEECHADKNKSKSASATKKWYCRPYYLVLWGLFACCVGAAIAIPLAIMGNSTLSPEQMKRVACDFLSLQDMTECENRTTYDSRTGESTTGSTIPSEIALLTKLTSLYLEDMRLKGTIPSEIGLMATMVGLSFSNNTLTGTIPSEIAQLTQLTDLAFSNNDLTGAVPPSLCSPRLVEFVEIDCSEITCDPECCSDDTGTSCTL